MTSHSEPTAADILDICNKPISSISQAMCKFDWNSETTEANAFWGGPVPIIAVRFEDERQSCLYIAATDTALVCRLSHANDYDTMTELIRQLGEEGDLEAHILIGTFDLDSVVCPEQGWVQLYVRKAVVVEAISSKQMLGLCLWVNLGIRLGLFVAELPGICMSFNDSCDAILKQAHAAQDEGLVRITVREYPGNTGTARVEKMRWFDWLRAPT